MHCRYLLAFLFIAFTSTVEAQRTALDSVRLADTTVIHVVKLRDGSTVVGRITALSADSIRLRLTEGEVSLARSGVSEVRQVPASLMRNGQYWFENPHSTRLLFSSTAFPLEKGTGYYSNAWLFMHAFAVGVTDRFTLGGGATTIPGIAFTDNLFYLLPKYTVFHTERTNVALGALIGGFPFNDDVNEDVTVGGLLYAVGSTGSRESNVSLGVAWGYADDEVTSSPGFMLGGQGRVSRRVSLISENWFVPIDGETEGVVSYGLRFLGENISADLAWVSPLGVDARIGFPWLGFAFKF
jgi:hypothetical protein